jgi:hypothetical protein
MCFSISRMTERGGGYCEFGDQGPDFQLIPSLGKELIRYRHRRARDFYLETDGEYLLAKCLQFIQELSASPLDIRVPVFALDWDPDCEITRDALPPSRKSKQEVVLLHRINPIDLIGQNSEAKLDY